MDSMFVGCSSEFQSKINEKYNNFNRKPFMLKIDFKK